MRVLFHGAGSANLGGAQLMRSEVHMEPGGVVVTNSKGPVRRSCHGPVGARGDLEVGRRPEGQLQERGAEGGGADRGADAGPERLLYGLGSENVRLEYRWRKKAVRGSQGLKMHGFSMC